MEPRRNRGASSCEVRPGHAPSPFSAGLSWPATPPHPTLTAGETEAGEGQDRRLGSGLWRLCPRVQTGGKAAGEIWIRGRAAPCPRSRNLCHGGSQGPRRLSEPPAQLLRCFGNCLEHIPEIRVPCPPRKGIESGVLGVRVGAFGFWELALLCG